MYAAINGLYGSHDPGVVHSDSYHGNIIVCGDGNLKTISDILNANEKLLVALHSQMSFKIMDIGFYQILDEADTLFDFVNGNRVDVLGDSLFSGEEGAEELIAMLLSLVDNIKKLKEATGNELNALLVQATSTNAKLSEAISGLEFLYIKYNNLLNLIEQKLARLQVLNTNLTKLETSTIAASALSKLYGDFLKLNDNIGDLNSEVDRQDRLTQRGIDQACQQLADLNGVISELTDSYRRCNDIRVVITSSKKILDELEDNIKLVDDAINDAGDGCQELDEYVKCLVIYAASIIRAGENIKIKKEGKVFKIDAVLPEPPDCPEIEFVDYEPRPTVAPTQKPTPAPTQKPTPAPTNAPTQKPTNAPTQKPTNAPTQKPTPEPTTTTTEAPDYIECNDLYTLVEDYSSQNEGESHRQEYEAIDTSYSDDLYEDQVDGSRKIMGGIIFVGSSNYYGDRIRICSAHAYRSTATKTKIESYYSKWGARFFVEGEAVKFDSREIKNVGSAEKYTKVVEKFGCRMGSLDDENYAELLKLL